MSVGGLWLHTGGIVPHWISWQTERGQKCGKRMDWDYRNDQRIECSGLCSHQKNKACALVIQNIHKSYTTIFSIFTYQKSINNEGFVDEKSSLAHISDKKIF